MKEEIILKLLDKLLDNSPCDMPLQKQEETKENNIHPMLNTRCLIRTYSAGVHIGDVTYINNMEVKLENSLRLWRWENGGLSLSSVAKNGIKGGRLNKTNSIYLTNVIEFIPTTEEAEQSFIEYIEDEE